MAAPPATAPRSAFVTVVAWIFIALMALGIAWNIGGVVAMVLFLPSLTEVLPPNRPELAHFGVMFKVMMAFNLVIVAAFVVLFGWVIKRLLSESVRREFVAAPGL